MKTIAPKLKSQGYKVVSYFNPTVQIYFNFTIRSPTADSRIFKMDDFSQF